MKRLALTLGILFLLAAAPAMAQMEQTTPQGSSSGGPQALEDSAGGQSGQTTMARSFQDVDRDGDGRVSQKEMREAQGGAAVQERSFQDYDRDGDGMLSQEEYEAMPRAGESDETQKYGITRDKGLTGGLSPVDGSGSAGKAAGGETGNTGSARDSSGGTRERGTSGDWGLTGPGGPAEPQGQPGDIHGGGEVGDQEGAGPAEVPNIETYGGRDYGTTTDYADTPPVGAQGGSGGPATPTGENVQRPEGNQGGRTSGSESQ